ncbi:MAG TPA: NAD(P)-binding domain-containing protein, partial [Ktedonobacterales bacterium]|nr:NAD(P)-binding domain-containing protein [Ktedonobacterales bacterium]
MADNALASLGAIGIIGAGAAGTTLARALTAHGAQIAAVASRSRASADALAALLPGARSIPPDDMPAAADLVLLAVSDAAITPLAETLPWRAGQGVAHLSGAHGAGALAAVTARGARPAALHPLMTFTRPAPDVPAEALLRRLSGCVWALEAEDP